MTPHASNAKHSPTCSRPIATSGKIRFSAILVLLSLLVSLQCLAAPPQRFIVENPRTSVKKHDLFVDLSVTVDDEDGLRNMLKDGAVLALSIAISVERIRSWWGNDEILEREYASTILHDPLTRNFVVSLPDQEGTKQYPDKNLTRLLHNTWRKLSLPLISIERLRADEPGSEYRITLNFSLQHTEVPPWLEKSLVFWSSNVVPKEKLILQYSLPADQQ